MAKLEEIAELLTEEINDFNKSIKKLEQLTEKINHFKFERDISEIKFQIEEQKRKLEYYSNYQNQKMDEISKKVSKARIIPNWLVVLSYFVMIMNISVIGFLVLYRFK